MHFLFLVHRSAQNRRQTYWKTILLNGKKLRELLTIWMRLIVFFWKQIWNAKKLVLLENLYKFYYPALLEKYADTVRFRKLFYYRS